MPVAGEEAAREQNIPTAKLCVYTNIAFSEVIHVFQS
jgi:hypothetical protein